MNTATVLARLGSPTEIQVDLKELEELRDRITAHPNLNAIEKRERLAPVEWWLGRLNSHR